MFTSPPLDAAEQAVRQQIQQLHDELGIHLRQGNRWTGALRRTTFARNVQGSNTIEGIHASVDEVEAIAAGEKPQSLSEETERALAGYQLAMTFVLQLAQTRFEIDGLLLRSLHFMTTSYDMSRWPGRFREGPVYVQEEATGDIVYEGAQPNEVEPLIAQFTEGAMEEDDILIAAAMAHLNFVLIHPFKDGNGRMARIVQSLIFASDGEVSPVFSTIEEYLGKHTAAYYEVLAKVGQGDWSTADFKPERARPWLRFVLTAHLNQALERKQRIEAAGVAAAGVETMVREAELPERSVEALYSTMFGGTVTRARYMLALAEAGEPVSEQTASRDLAALSAAGLLSAEGDKRGRRYLPGQRVLELVRDSGLGRAWRHQDPFAS